MFVTYDHVQFLPQGRISAGQTSSSRAGRNKFRNGPKLLKNEFEGEHPERRIQRHIISDLPCPESFAERRRL
jgi:hypothetical protein